MGAIFSPTMTIFLLFSFLTLLYLLLLGITSRSSRSRSHAAAPPPRLPPGPRKLPVIGNMHLLLGPASHRVLRDLARKHGPLMQMQLGEVPTVVASSAEAAREVMKTQDTKLCTRPRTIAAEINSYNRTTVSFSPYGNYWRQMRKICVMELLSAKRVGLSRSVREEETHELMVSLASSSSSSSNPAVVDLSEKLYLLSNGVIARTALGKKSVHQKRFMELTRKLLELGGAVNVADFFPSSKLVRVISGVESRLEKCHREQDSLLDDIIQEHRLNSKDGDGGSSEDFVDVLLRIQKDNALDFPLTDDNIKAVVLDMIVAGGETSATTLQWAMSELIQNPEAMERAQAEVRAALKDKKHTRIMEPDVAELSYLKLVIKETLRLHPPAPLLLPRECMEPCHLLGYDVPAKTRALVNVWAISRDPRHWEEPDRFKPERFDGNPVDFWGNDFEFTPFGAGRRICPGINFGLASMELPLAQLLYYFDWELPNAAAPAELDMTETLGLAAGRSTALRLCPILRNHVATTR